MNNELRLVAPCEDLRGSFMEAVAEFHARGEDWPHGAYGHDRRALEDFDEYVRAVGQEERGEGLPEGYVPCSTYWLVVGTGSGGGAGGNEVLGTLSFRHRLNERLEHEGGHIGYCIRPSARGRGYMTRFLRLALEEARRRGLARVLITCAQSNVASARVIQKCGGALEDERPSRMHVGELVQRYWVEL